MQAKSLIKKALDERNMSMAQLVVLLQENGIQTSYSNLHNKLQRDSIKYTEVLEIMHVLEFEIKMQNKSAKSTPIIRHKTDESVEKLKRKIAKLIMDDQKEFLREVIKEHFSTLIEESYKNMKQEISSELGIQQDFLTKNNY